MKSTQMSGYVAVILDEESRHALAALAVHGEVHCHHQTVFFKPDEGQFAAHFALRLDEIVTLTVVGIAQDDRGQAVAVDGVDGLPSNRRPHVTVSCAPGTKPAYSNELLQMTELRPIAMTLKGRVAFVPF